MNILISPRTALISIPIRLVATKNTKLAIYIPQLIYIAHTCYNQSVLELEKVGIEAYYKGIL